jgi:hypothetical protein
LKLEGVGYGSDQGRFCNLQAYDAEGRLIMWLEGSKIAFGGDKVSALC